MKNDHNWYAKKSWIIIHSIFSLLFVSIAAYGYALMVGFGIGGGKGMTPQIGALIGVFIIGGTLTAIYCFIMSVTGLFKHNKNNTKANIIILLSLSILSAIKSLPEALGILSIYNRLSYITILDFVLMLSSLGTLLGAIIMFFRNKKGLYIYSLFQLTYIISIIAMLFYNFDMFTLFISCLTVIFPAVLFLLLYWSKQIRENLT